MMGMMRIMSVLALLFYSTIGSNAAVLSGDFCPGTGAEIRSSDNYMIADTLGQFVVGQSRSCAEGVDPMECPYSCTILEHGFWHSDIYIPTIPDIKQSEEYDQVNAYAKTVTAGNDQLYRTFYIADQDRLGAIKVNVGTNPDIHVSEGDMVDVSGVIKTANRERYIDYPEVMVRFANAMQTSAYFSSTRWLGGSGTDVLTLGGVGTNNISMLMKTSGTVTYTDTATPSKFFYIDDGSGPSDGTIISGLTMRGIRVQINSLATGNTISPPSVGQYVTVTGICSPQNVSGRILAQLRPRDQADIQIL